ncbi:hypothetical protein [Pseudonocardia sp. H11422]|uniref:hypothetical protein n=1 Tax=Pseudonocardia sp. H11422 TaxID=2835866 RepID=UPI001BDBDACC|nr:hypothetical protein [Pseudonocardia sp. H11422]
MTVAAYEPPVQSKRGQLIDAATVLVLIFATLFATTFLVQESQTADTPAGEPTRQLDELPITAAERAQFEKLIESGTADLPAVTAAVDASQGDSGKYDFRVPALIGTAALLAIYLTFVYRTSFREYREVIEEKFGPRDGGGSA